MLMSQTVTLYGGCRQDIGGAIIYQDICSPAMRACPSIPACITPPERIQMLTSCHQLLIVGLFAFLLAQETAAAFDSVRCLCTRSHVALCDASKSAYIVNVGDAVNSRRIDITCT